MAKKGKSKDKADADDDGGGKKKLLSPKKLAIVAVVGVVVYTQFLSGGGGEAEAGPTTLPEPVEGAVVEVDESVRVSLADEDQHYALIGMAVVLESAADPLVVTERLPLLRSAAVEEAITFTAADLKAADGPRRLADALTGRADGVFNTEGEQPLVLRVEVTELLVQ